MTADGRDGERDSAGGGSDSRWPVTWADSRSPRDGDAGCDRTSTGHVRRRAGAATRRPGRWLLVAALVGMVVLSGMTGVADAWTATGPTSVPSADETFGGGPTVAVTEPVLGGPGDGATPQVTEVVIRASLTGDAVLRAGFFEVVTRVNATLDTSGATDVGGTYDVNITDTGGEFSIRGQVVGTVDATRALFTFERYATGEGLSETPPATAGRSGTVDGESGQVDRRTAARHQTATALGAVSTAGFGGPVAAAPRAEAAALPLQLNPWRQLGVSFMDLYWILSTLLLGVVLVGVLPRFSRRVADLGASEPLRTGGTGLLVVLVTPLALLLFGLSLFGIPLALAGTAVYLVLGWVGAVYGRFTVGMWVLAALPRVLAAADVDVRPVENRWAGLLLGSFLVGLVALLPAVGPVVDGLVVLLGLGAVTRLAYGSYGRTEREGGADADSVTDPVSE